MIESSQGRSCFSYSTIQREETFEGETFTNFAVLWLFVKFWGMAFFGVAKANNLRKFSPRKSYFSLIRESFLP